jgi:hypothetical protein
MTAKLDCNRSDDREGGPMPVPSPKLPSWSPSKLSVIRLDVVGSDVPRLLAPGLPESMQADGRRVGWVLRGAFWLLSDDGVVSVPELGTSVVAALPGRNAWVLLTEDRLWLGDPATGIGHLLDLGQEDPDVELRPGVSWIVLAGGEGTRVLASPVEAADPALGLPAGARASLALAPWSDGAGLVWVDDNTIYRMAAGRRPSAIGQVSVRADALVSGPLGAVVVQAPDEFLAAAAGGLLVPLAQDVDLGTLRFSPDGLGMLAAVAGGVALVDLTTGRFVRRWEGPLLPVGWFGGPVLLDEARGALLRDDGSVVLEGFSLAGMARWESFLHGPGASAWDLGFGRRMSSFGALHGHVATAGPSGLFCADDTTGRWLRPDGSEASVFRLPFLPDASAGAALAALREETGDAGPSVEETVWMEGSRVAIVDANGTVWMVDAATGELHGRIALDPQDDDGPANVWIIAGKLLLRTGGTLRLLPDDIALPAGQTELVALARGTLFRAGGGRVEALDLRTTGALWHADGMDDAWMLAVGRFLYVADGDDLLVLDPVTGEARERRSDACAGVARLEVLADGRLLLLGDTDDAPEIRSCTPRGKELSTWNLPADGAAIEGGVIYAWTEDGSLVALT